MSHFIDSQWIEGEGLKFVSTNPANNEILWEGREATREEVDRAVTAARKAFPSWSALSIRDREEYLEKFVELLKKKRSAIAETISKEMGKALWESEMELGGMINKLKVSAEAFAERSSIVAKEIASSLAATRHKAHGVVAIYGPYNFPGHLPNGHIIPALLAGNTVIFKASELTPLVAQEVVKVWEEAKLPTGVLNLVQGAKNTGIALAEHSGIDGLFFTGSSETGKLLHQQFAGQPGKILALEMGGNNPLLVFDVKDINAAVYHTIQSAFITAGQRCTCARRLIIPDGDFATEFIDRLVTQTKKIIIGAYDSQPEPFMGPVISHSQAARLLAEQSALKNSAAKVLLEMKTLVEGTGLLSPGIIDVTGIRVEDKEIFGPLLQVSRVKDFNAAINLANDTVYGLAAGLISDSEDLYREFYQRIRAGIVNWNNQLTGASSAAPFGGIGLSGNHRPSAYYAADYCSYPVASLESTTVKLPETLSPGMGI